MFVGSYTPKLDEKNRLFLPAKFRDQLVEGLVVTKGQDFCLNVFPIADFAAMTNRLQEAPLTVRQAREYGRFLAMRATEDKPDKQGRITIPPLLKEYAGLAREVVVIGALNRVEIWDPDPDRRLGGRAQPGVRGDERGRVPGLARLTPPARRPRQDNSDNTTQGFAQRGLAPAPAIWGTFPGSRRPLPTTSPTPPHVAGLEGAGRDLVGRIPLHITTSHPPVPSSGVEPMSLTPTAPPVGGLAPGPRRVRHQARDVVALMAFSATTSVAVAVGLLLLAHLARAGR